MGFLGWTLSESASAEAGANPFGEWSGEALLPDEKAMVSICRVGYLCSVAATRRQWALLASTCLLMMFGVVSLPDTLSISTGNSISVNGLSSPEDRH